MAVDDPFVSDEGSLLMSYAGEPGEGETPATRAAVISGEFSKRVTEHLGISIGLGFRHLRPDGEKTKNGFENLDLGAEYQLLPAPHETLISIGIDSELGGTGRQAVGAESFSTISPALLFGKGFATCRRD